MIRVHVICEGQTEEEFIRSVLGPALLKRQLSLSPSCIGRVGHKGGNVNLSRLAVDVKARLLGDRRCYCTTLFDYYGLPGDFPGKSEGALFIDIADKQTQVVQALSKWSADTLGHQPASRFIPYVQMYEFEALLFSDPSRMANAIGCADAEVIFQRIRSDFSTPEWINGSPQSAPSKRISKIFPAYDKPEHPLLAALDIGVDTIRRECSLFDAWIQRLETLAAGSGA